MNAIQRRIIKIGLTIVVLSEAVGAAKDGADTARGIHRIKGCVSTDSPKADQALASADQKWGTLQGRLVIQGELKQQLIKGRDGGVADVVVYLADKNVSIHPAYDRSAKEPVTIAAGDNAFEPRIALMRTTQPLVFRNATTSALDFHWQPINNTGIERLLDPGAEFRVPGCLRSETIPTPLVSHVKHDLKGYLLIRDNPYFTTSAMDGSFTIENLPIGPREIQLWHELAGLLRMPDWPRGRLKVTIQSGVNDLGALKIDTQVLKSADSD